MKTMIPIQLAIILMIIEAGIFLFIFSFKLPDKGYRVKIRQFANEHNLSMNRALNWILKQFFVRYDNGLKETLIHIHKTTMQPFEDWDEELENQIQIELGKRQKEHVTK